MTQSEALNILKTGANVFLTGEPGSGKTHTVNQYVSWLRDRLIEPSITASTGIAATHIGGHTVHSWSGIGIRSFLDKYELDRIASNKRVYTRVKNARILIIDEVSMLSEGTLSMVDAVCREIRRSEEAFGGLQVVFVGDFFQLPPVFRREVKEVDEENQELFVEEEERSMFAFASPAWQNAKPIVCYLSEQHRQEDKKFLDFLSAVRRGEVSEDHMVLLRTRYAKAPKNGTTELYSHNADVDKINIEELSKLPDGSVAFVMQSQGPEPMVLALKRGCLSPESLNLKIGARVMFTKNDIIARQYSNGTLGIVTGFSKEGGAPMIKVSSGRTIIVEPTEWHLEDNGRVLARISQIPLRLAWAITVHKSQGMSLDSAHMDLSGAFEYGQGYVALSRVRTLAGLSLAGLNARALEVHPEIMAKDEEFRASAQMARERFLSLSPDELLKFHKNFVRACGGTFEPVSSGQRPRTSKPVKVLTHEITKALLPRKLSLKEMASERKITVGTIIAHLELLAEKGSISPSTDCLHLRPETKRFEKIKKAFKTTSKKDGPRPLTPVRELLGNSYSFDELRLSRLFL
ncbi:MAG: AAA family ATPase [Candidatus Taylorbacteria bacterium]|nr:AAA family ATPase [Candidatus Taylorbacteria bacterium]